jgi:hypothetical protein
MPGGFDMQGVSGEGGFDMQGVPTDMQGVTVADESQDTGENVATYGEMYTIVALAARLKLKPATVYKYRSLGLLPEPDEFVNHSPLWKPVTIDRWLPTRPGRGVGGGAPMHRKRRERRAP